MNELSSFLPLIEPHDTPKMRIERITLESFPSHRCKTNIHLATSVGTSPIFAHVYKIDNPLTNGFIPTKVWHADDSLQFLYYVSKFLPPAARPFGDDPCYVFVVYTRDGDAVEYDADIRLYIDQVLTPCGMAYVFIFGEQEMRRMLATHWSGESWNTATPIIHEWDTLIQSETTNVF